MSWQHSGKNRAARMRTRPLSSLRKQGPHTPRRKMLKQRWWTALPIINYALWLWVPAFAGTTAEGYSSFAAFFETSFFFTGFAVTFAASSTAYRIALA